MGRAILSYALTLCDMMCLPTFKFKLIFINRLCVASSLQFFLLPIHVIYRIARARRL